MVNCGECWAGHNCQCNKAKIGEWISIPVRVNSGVVVYYFYFHMARVKRAIRIGILSEGDVL